MKRHQKKQRNTKDLQTPPDVTPYPVSSDSGTFWPFHSPLTTLGVKPLSLGCGPLSLGRGPWEQFGLVSKVLVESLTASIHLPADASLYRAVLQSTTCQHVEVKKQIQQYAMHKLVQLQRESSD